MSTLLLEHDEIWNRSIRESLGFFLYIHVDMVLGEEFFDIFPLGDVWQIANVEPRTLVRHADEGYDRRCCRLCD